ncbi:NAD-dependent epimerase/dehydratase family protein [Gottfriedia solisilvae]|uniref:NAD-dependent epimerase/dehydratase family protein n=1 Tax=Gottfriedia solisilvae TaxID=1516104 RepID=UPI003D2ED806
MRVFVSGATGFLGKHTVKKLSEIGYDVIAFGRNEQAANFFKTMDNVVFVKGDLEDKQLLAKLVKDVDFVIHCAALAAPYGQYELFYKTNVDGTQNIVDASLSSNIKKFIYLSTPSVYFTNESRKNVRENDELPQSHTNYYASTKHIADLIVKEAVLKGLPAISLRPRQVFGPYDHTIFGRLIDTNKKRGIPLVNKGKILMDFTYVDNVVDVIMLSLMAEDQFIGEFYNITNDQPIYLIDALTLLYSYLNEELNTKKISPKLLSFISSSSEMIANITGKPPILSKHVASFLSYDYTLNIDKIKNDLQYTPKISLSEGMNRYTKWYLQENQ